MTPSRIRKSILLLVAFAAGAGSLFVAGTALAQATALFRIEQRTHGFPSPPVTTPGGAGMYQGYLIPYYLTDIQAKSGTLYDLPPGTAKAVPFNPIGAPFTLPKSIYTIYSQATLTKKTAWPGYTTTYWFYAYNGTGMFKPNNGPTAPYRMMFKTTNMNYTKTEPNLGLGNPLTPTTTFNGR
jgi:hypothetical protein